MKTAEFINKELTGFAESNVKYDMGETLYFRYFRDQIERIKSMIRELKKDIVKAHSYYDEILIILNSQK